MDTAAGSPDFFILVTCAVIVGNFLTVIFVAGWRGYMIGRKQAGAPLWSYFAILGAGIFVGGALISFIAAILMPML